MSHATSANDGFAFVFACDAGFAMPLATTIRSLAETNLSHWPIQVYILSSGFSEETKQKIVNSLPPGFAVISWLPVDLKIFNGFSTIKHISAATYARLLIPDMLPANVEKVLYLDADLLVLADLGPLLRTDLGGNVLAAVADERLDWVLKAGEMNLPGLPRVRDYFNAGVLLMDLPSCRTKRISERAFEYLSSNPHSPYSDQDALNVACDGLWKKLDAHWNRYQVDLEKPLDELAPERRPGIVHFHGSLKPWDPNSLNWHAGFYDSFRNRTLFACTSRERLQRCPFWLWSKLKRIMKRSAVLRLARNEFRSVQPPDGPNSARRLSA